MGQQASNSNSLTPWPCLSEPGHNPCRVLKAFLLQTPIAQAALTNNSTPAAHTKRHLEDICIQMIPAHGKSGHEAKIRDAGNPAIAPFEQHCCMIPVIVSPARLLWAPDVPSLPRQVLRGAARKRFENRQEPPIPVVPYFRPWHSVKTRTLPHRPGQP